MERCLHRGLCQQVLEHDSKRYENDGMRYPVAFGRLAALRHSYMYVSGQAQDLPSKVRLLDSDVCNNPLQLRLLHMPLGR